MWWAGRGCGEVDWGVMESIDVGEEEFDPDHVADAKVVEGEEEPDYAGRPGVEREGGQALAVGLGGGGEGGPGHAVPPCGVVEGGPVQTVGLSG